MYFYDFAFFFILVMKKSNTSHADNQKLAIRVRRRNCGCFMFFFCHVTSLNFITSSCHFVEHRGAFYGLKWRNPDQINQ